MKVINENKFSNIFPMRIVCKRVVDAHGYAYGKEKDFCGSELEIEAEDIKKHIWYKYPCYEGVDYGLFVLYVENLFPWMKMKFLIRY